MKVKMLFWKNIDENHKHENEMIYYHCIFRDDWIMYPYLGFQSLYNPQHRFKRLNLSRGK